MTALKAAERAAARVAAVEDSPDGRLALLHELYAPADARERGRHLPYRRAANAFMNWQVGRGLLEPLEAPAPGSPWWRAVNSQLLRDTAEARALAVDTSGDPSSDSVAVAVEFIRQPSAGRWYRAHNHSIVSAYVAHADLAEREGRVERFFINLALVRVLYAHALVAAPRLALGPLAPVAPPLGDPRLGMTAIFLSLSRVLPATYPLGDDVRRFVDEEHGFGHLLDVGVIQPRVERLYDWSAKELGIPELRGLLDGDVPAYAWDSAESDVWHPRPSRVARLARRVVR
ncbi:MAG TPA: hypothetical protein VM093_09285 [Aeromicrobium sp.]|nr:hypothetical protein [Aeromicrobium sp.]